MADEIPESTKKTEEEKAHSLKKRELRRVRDEIKVLRKQSKELSEKRKALDETYKIMAEEAGLPPREKKPKD